LGISKKRYLQLAENLLYYEVVLKILILTLSVCLIVGVIFSYLVASIVVAHIVIAIAFIILLGCASKESMRIPLLVFYFLILGVGLFLLLYGAYKYQVYNGNELILLKFSLPISLPLALILYLHQKKKLAEGSFYTTEKLEGELGDEYREVLLAEGTFYTTKKTGGELVDEHREVLGQDVYISFMAFPIRDIKLLLAFSGFIILTLFTWGFFIFTNGFFDNSSPQSHRVVIIKKKAQLAEKTYEYCISFNHWESKDTKTIEVDRRFWDSVKKMMPSR
jgi:hypothetical protein